MPLGKVSDTLCIKNAHPEKIINDKQLMVTPCDSKMIPGTKRVMATHAGSALSTHRVKQGGGIKGFPTNAHTHKHTHAHSLRHGYQGNPTLVIKSHLKVH